MNEGPVTLYHQSEGAGEPLILLNGIAMSVVSWDVVARPLARQYRVIRCDFRGQLMTPAAESSVRFWPHATPNACGR